MRRRLVGICSPPHDCRHNDIGTPGRRSCSVLRRLVAAAIGLSGLFAATALPARAQLQLHAKGRSEGAFVFYVGGPTAPWEAKAKIFEQRYPGIKVSITGGFSNVLDKKIEQQLKDDKLEVDAAIFQTQQDFVRCKAEGHLLSYKPQGFDAIEPSFKDPDGAFYGTSIWSTRNTSAQPTCRTPRLIFSSRNSAARR